MISFEGKKRRIIIEDAFQEWRGGGGGGEECIGSEAREPLTVGSRVFVKGEIPRQTAPIPTSIQPQPAKPYEKSELPLARRSKLD